MEAASCSFGHLDVLGKVPLKKYKWLLTQRYPKIIEGLKTKGLKKIARQIGGTSMFK